MLQIFTHINTSTYMNKYISVRNVNVLTQFLCVQHSGCSWLTSCVIAERNGDCIEGNDNTEKHCASYIR